jgi:hypothetical protein
MPDAAHRRSAAIGEWVGGGRVSESDIGRALTEISTEHVANELVAVPVILGNVHNFTVILRGLGNRRKVHIFIRHD